VERSRRTERTTEYTIAIIVSLIFLYVFNNLLNWHIYFVTNALNDVLWIINLSLIATIIGNALFILYRADWFRHLVKIVINIFNIIAVYLVYLVFPFNFNNSFFNWALNILLILIMIGIVIAIIVEFYHLITRKTDY